MAAFEGKGLKSLKAALKDTIKKMPKLMIANWKLWPICTILQLLYFGVHTATIFGIAVGFLWGIYLSFTENRKNKKGNMNEQKQEEEY